MKLLLIQPPIQDFYDTDVRLQPIGLCYLKAAVNKHLPEVAVTIRDFHGGCGRRTVPLPKELAYLRQYYAAADRSPFSAFHQYFQFGKPFDEIETEIAQLKPDLVGISSLFTPYYREALEVAARVKKRLDVAVVMGGSHASAAPESLLSSPHVDFLIFGEGEKPLVELLRHLRGQAEIDRVPNLGFKQRGKLRFNSIGENYAMDELPFPDLSDFPPARYTLCGKPMTFMITSRSCPHKCSFCSVHTTFGRNYRRRSLEDALAEIELRHRQGYRVIDFEDDNLTYYKPVFKELCRRLIARFPDRQMEFVAMNGISYLSLDDELLELMFAAGFTRLNLALVSSDKTVRETTKRPHTLEHYLKTVRKARLLGFEIVSYQILGLPNETLESMIQTLAFNARLPVLLGASPFYQTPNAPIARGLAFAEQDFIRARLTAMAIETDHFARDDIYTLFVTTRIINFLKGLELDCSTDMASLLNRQWSDQRTQVGIELLARLWRDQRLCLWTREGMIENRRFRSELFKRVFLQAGEIACQNGVKILLGHDHSGEAHGWDRALE